MDNTYTNIHANDIHAFVNITNAHTYNNRRRERYLAKKNTTEEKKIPLEQVESRGKMRFISFIRRVVSFMLSVCGIIAMASMMFFMALLS